MVNFWNIKKEKLKVCPESGEGREIFLKRKKKETESLKKENGEKDTCWNKRRLSFSKGTTGCTVNPIPCSHAQKTVIDSYISNRFNHIQTEPTFLFTSFNPPFPLSLSTILCVYI